MDLIETIKKSNKVTISGKSYAVVGIEADEPGQYCKFILDTEPVRFLEVPYSEGGKFVLWEASGFVPPEGFEAGFDAGGKHFTFDAEGVSDTPEGKVHWWDFASGRERYSIGKNISTGKWENLRGWALKLGEVCA
ncbi:MAG: hypothetical protein JW834_03670 [Candidatus Diapherotrites archaeon]|nr:hypothetical protein [Candidatus Diapherotrites archaeon]